VLHRPAVFTAPAFGMRLVLGEAADELALASLRVVPRVLQDAGFTFRHLTVRDALTAATER
jgi:NAD dependent epimerase/dehydratase family enzyme